MRQDTWILCVYKSCPNLKSPVSSLLVSFWFIPVNVIIKSMNVYVTSFILCRHIVLLLTSPFLTTRVVIFPNSSSSIIFSTRLLFFYPGTVFFLLGPFHLLFIRLSQTPTLFTKCILLVIPVTVTSCNSIRVSLYCSLTSSSHQVGRML